MLPSGWMLWFREGQAGPLCSGRPLTDSGHLLCCGTGPGTEDQHHLTGPEAARVRPEDHSHSALPGPRDGGRGGFNQWNRRHGPQIRGLRPQGPGTPQRGSNNGGDGGEFLVSAELHGATAPVLSGEQGCPLHPQDAENGRSRAPTE